MCSLIGAVLSNKIIQHDLNSKLILTHLNIADAAPFVDNHILHDLKHQHMLSSLKRTPCSEACILCMWDMFPRIRGKACGLWVSVRVIVSTRLHPTLIHSCLYCLHILPLPYASQYQCHPIERHILFISVAVRFFTPGNASPDSDQSSFSISCSSLVSSLTASFANPGSRF